MANIPVLDITTLDTHNTKIIGMVDLSTYPNNFQIINPTIQITPPAFPRVSLIMSIRNLNVFNSNMLGITCNVPECNLAEIPDGLWKFNYSISPSNTYFVEKSFMRTELIEVALDKAFLRTSLIQCDQDIKSQDLAIIDQIRSYIQGAIADGNNCNFISAMDKYRQAERMLKNFVKSKS